MYVRQQVLHEAGYKCANPACRHPQTLDVHHLIYVSEGGADMQENLLPLCKNCHDLHHKGDIPTESLRAWKMLLMALNAAFDRRAIDLLLTIAIKGRIESISGDGVPVYAPLVASNLVTLQERPYRTSRDVQHRYEYVVFISDRGKLFVEAWKQGDQRAAIELIPAGGKPE